MSRQWRLLRIALAYFTRIPLPPVQDFAASELQEAARYLPLIGWLAGGVAALVFYLAALVLPIEVAVLLSMVATIWLTGALHEDGLADTMDGLGGGWTKEQALTIMKDSRIGSYGVIALMLALLVKYQSLTHMPLTLLPLAMWAAHAVSRFAVLLLMAQQEYVRDEGKAKAVAGHFSAAGMGIAATAGLIPLLFLPIYTWWALLPVALVWFWFSHKLKQRLGGYTGDCLGAMQQLTELAFYLGILVWSV